MGGNWGASGGFFADADFDYEARIVLGAAASGIGDVGLVLATLDRVTDGDPQSWFDAWTQMAADLTARGDEALRRSHPETASWAFLAAAEYYAKALVFVDGLADQSVLLPTFREGRSCWEQVVDASQGRSVRMQVPNEDTLLPGYLLRPDDTGAARPTLVMINGSDGSLPGMVGYGAAEAIGRDWNVFLFAVLAPVIDFLAERRDVNSSALTGYGISQGGYWITRALAFERRMVAAVADPRVVDVVGPITTPNFHCQPTGRRLTHTQMLDWLADHLPARQAADVSPARRP